MLIASPVTHFSTWNVDWPISSHGCISGVIVGADGGVQSGVEVSVMGTTYTGRGPEIVTGPDGRFCSDILRSEAAGEDVDNNGVTGEVQRVRVIVTEGKEVYDGKEHQSPVTQGSCGGSCLDVGQIRLDESSRFPVQLCAVNGRVVDRSGVPLDGVSVTGVGTGDYEDAQLMCPGTFDCMVMSQQTHDGGVFSGKVVVREKLSVTASKTDQPSPDTNRTAVGTREYVACPAGQLELALSTVFLQRTLTVSVTGSTISWTPTTAVQVLSVENGGTTKWLVSGAGFSGPVTYGQAPAGTFVPMGPIGALASGDNITVTSSAMVNGDILTATGTYTVP